MKFRMKIFLTITIVLACLSPIFLQFMPIDFPINVPNDDFRLEARIILNSGSYQDTIWNEDVIINSTATVTLTNCTITHATISYSLIADDNSWLNAYNCTFDNLQINPNAQVFIYNSTVRGTKLGNIQTMGPPSIASLTIMNSTFDGFSMINMGSSSGLYCYDTIFYNVSSLQWQFNTNFSPNNLTFKNCTTNSVGSITLVGDQDLILDGLTTDINTITMFNNASLKIHDSSFSDSVDFDMFNDTTLLCDNNSFDSLDFDAPATDNRANITFGNTQFTGGTFFDIRLDATMRAYNLSRPGGLTIDINENVALNISDSATTDIITLFLRGDTHTTLNRTSGYYQIIINDQADLQMQNCTLIANSVINGNQNVTVVFDDVLMIAGNAGDYQDNCTILIRNSTLSTSFDVRGTGQIDVLANSTIYGWVVIRDNVICTFDNSTIAGSGYLTLNDFSEAYCLNSSGIRDITTNQDSILYVNESTIGDLEMYDFSQGNVTYSNFTEFDTITIRGNTDLTINYSYIGRYKQVEAWGNGTLIIFNCTAWGTNNFFMRNNATFFFLNTTINATGNSRIQIGESAQPSTAKGLMLGSTFPELETFGNSSAQMIQCLEFYNQQQQIQPGDNSTILIDSCQGNVSMKNPSDGYSNLTVLNTNMNNIDVGDKSFFHIQDSLIYSVVSIRQNATASLINCSSGDPMKQQIQVGNENPWEYNVANVTLREVHDFETIDIVERTQFNIENCSAKNVRFGAVDEYGLPMINGRVNGTVTNLIADRLQIGNFSQLTLNNVVFANLSVGYSYFWLNGSDSLLYSNDSNIVLNSVQMVEGSFPMIYCEKAGKLFIENWYSDNFTVMADGRYPDAYLKIHNSTIKSLMMTDSTRFNNVDILDSIILEDTTLNAMGVAANLNITNSEMIGLIMSMIPHTQVQYIYESTIKSMFWLLSGDFRFTDTSFVEGGYLWLATHLMSFDFTNNVSLIDSYCEELRLNGQSNVTTRNASFSVASFYDESTGHLIDSNFAELVIKNDANVLINGSTIDVHEFTSPNVAINNSVVRDAAPILVPLSSPITNPESIILNWTLAPGVNFTGSIKNYTIYRANTSKFAAAPPDLAYSIIGWIEYPDPYNLSEVSFQDLEPNMTTAYDGNKLWYKVGITDEGNNRANSTPVAGVLQKTARKLEANIFYDRELTTFDNVSINIFIPINDVDEDGDPDIEIIYMNYIMFYANDTNQTMFAIISNTTWEIVEDLEYQFNLTASYCQKIEFEIIMNTTGFNSTEFGFNSSKIPQDFSIRGPMIQFGDMFRPMDERIIESYSLTLTINVLEDAPYVDSVAIWYRLNEPYNLGTWEEALFTYNSTAFEYTFSFDSFFGLNYESIEFYVSFNDTTGNQYYLLGDASNVQTYLIYPTFPSFYLSNPAILIWFVLGSCIVGVVFGTSYLTFKKQSSKESKKELKQMQDKVAKAVRGGKVKTTGAEAAATTGIVSPTISSSKVISANVMKFNILYILGLLGLGATLVFGTLFSFAGDYNYATLILMLAMFLSFYVYIIWMFRESKYSIRREKLSVLRIGINFTHMTAFIAVTIYFLIIGSNISWFNYYIVQQSGSPPFAIPFTPLVFPSLYLKIVSLVFSTLIAFTLSVYWDIRLSVRDTKVYQRQNANITVILYSKEELIRKTFSRINYKIIIFLVLIGIAMLPISADGFLAVLPTALIIIGPAFLAFLAFFVVGFFMKTKLDPFGLILEPVVQCPSCNFTNVQSSQFCGKCRSQLTVEQEVFTDTMSCVNCGAINPIDYNFCKACGKELSNRSKSSTYYPDELQS